MRRPKILLIAVFVIMGLVLCLYPRGVVQADDDYLAQETIEITIEIINSQVEVDFSDDSEAETAEVDQEEETGETEGINTADSTELNLNLAEETETEVQFTTRGNISYELKFDSETGLFPRQGEGENLDQYFEYYIEAEGAESSGDESEGETTFAPGESLNKELIQDNTEPKDWSFGLRLKQDMAEIWNSLIEDMSPEELPEGEWTDLAEGEYEDMILITITGKQN